MIETVHVKVIKGSVGTFKDGSFKKDDVFETSREEALKIDPSFIQILEDQPVAEEPKEELTPPKGEAVEETTKPEYPEESKVIVVEVPEEPAPKKKRKKASADA